MVNWKLKLKYGKLKTDFIHYTVLADASCCKVNAKYNCPDGPAWASMKMWSKNEKECADMIKYFGNKMGFICLGDIQIHISEPVKPPKKKPFGYDLKFNPYKN